MKLEKFSPAQFILRPAVVFAMVYITMWCVRFLWILCTVKFSATGGAETFRAISSSEYALLSVGNLLVAGVVIGDGLHARAAPGGLRRQHAVGMFMTVLTVALVQLAGFYAHRVIPLPL